jgi:anti-anti-sigma factor
MMRIDVEQAPNGRVVVRPFGSIDAVTAADLKTSLKQAALGGSKQVIVDLGAVDFIDSSGLSALISGLKALRQNGGGLSLSGPNPQAMTALRLTMLDRVFAVFPSLDAALK